MLVEYITLIMKLPSNIKILDYRFHNLFCLRRSLWDNLYGGAVMEGRSGREEGSGGCATSQL